MPLSSVIGASSILKPGVCTSSTRPAAPFEGQTIYETDTDLLLTYDGSGWVAYRKATAGQVLQVVSTTKTDTFTTTSTTFVDVTGLDVTITPSATSSKIFIVANIAWSHPAANASAGFVKLTGGNAGNYIGDASGSKVRAVWGGYSFLGRDREMYSHSIMYLDSPATTSATTYKVQVAGGGTSGGTASINEAKGVVNDGNSAVGASSITVMEISG